MRATIASPTSEVERVASPRSATSAATARCTFAAGSALPEVVEQECDGEDRGGGVGDALPGDVGCRAVDRLEHAGESAVGVDVARGRQADAAADRAGQVGEDVAEEVVRDDDIESSRIRDEEDRRGVDVQVVDRDVGILGRDRVDRALPERPGEDEHVGLVHEREPLARASGCRGERVAHDALDAVRGVHRDLVRDLVRRARRGSRRRCRRTAPRCPRGRRRSRPRPGRRAGSRRPGTAPTAAGSRSGRARSAASAAVRARCWRPRAAGSPGTPPDGAEQDRVVRP